MSVKQLRKDLKYFDKHIECPGCGMSMRRSPNVGYLGGVLYTIMYECSNGHHQAMYRGRRGPTSRSDNAI